MGLLDLFTGAASQRAAKNNVSAIQAGTGLATDALGKGYNSAIGYLGLNDGGGAMGALGTGYGQARNDINAGYAAAAPALSQLGSQYAPMAAGGQKAFDSFLDASGANGADGSARATENFRAAPGYEYQRDQALEAVQRSAAARGGLAGGNATSDILKTATGLADQSYQQYVNNLNTGAGYYQTGLAGQGQGLSAQAGAAIGQGTQLGALGTGLGTAQAGLWGTGAGLQSQFGRDVAGVQTGASNALVLNNNNLAQSENAAGANILGGILGIGNLALGGAGGAAGRAAGGSAASSGGGGFLTGLANLFR